MGSLADCGLLTSFQDLYVFAQNRRHHEQVPQNLITPFQTDLTHMSLELVIPPDDIFIYIRDCTIIKAITDVPLFRAKLQSHRKEV